MFRSLFFHLGLCNYKGLKRPTTSGLATSGQLEDDDAQAEPLSLFTQQLGFLESWALIRTTSDTTAGSSESFKDARRVWSRTAFKKGPSASFFIPSDALTPPQFWASPKQNPCHASCATSNTGQVESTMQGEKQTETHHWFFALARNFAAGHAHSTMIN